VTGTGSDTAGTAGAAGTTGVTGIDAGSRPAAIVPGGCISRTATTQALIV